MTLINPKTYDAIYKGKRDRDKIEFIYIPEAPFAGSLISKSPLSYLDVDVISLNELAKVELKGRDKSGKYRVEMYLTNGTKLFAFIIAFLVFWALPR